MKQNIVPINLQGTSFPSTKRAKSTTSHMFKIHSLLVVSVTSFGEISPLWQNVKSPWQFFEG